MSNLTDKLKVIAQYHQNESGITDKRAFKMFLQHVKSTYYNMNKAEQAKFIEDWDKGVKDEENDN